MNPAPYNINQVDRKAIFVFDAGREIYELIDPEDRRWVIQTWSQTVDRALALADLPALASRLSLPPGWRYESRTPSTPLRVDYDEHRSLRHPGRSGQQLLVADLDRDERAQNVRIQRRVGVQTRTLAAVKPRGTDPGSTRYQ
ncbi:hypothetical protein C8E89_108107 [Mycolicibacterium moriokaense]|uniref:Uncharacterized protein n=1 Tax=Mycolicibacterium moriokaense TaxID=39691 RepID=A0A318HG14_9MYCO|nr:hypothetical protein C8E89_108107 [Mycolicibacterium moriokaense]